MVPFMSPLLPDSIDKSSALAPQRQAGSNDPWLYLTFVAQLQIHILDSPKSNSPSCQLS